MALSVGTASTANFSSTATPSALTLAAAVAAGDVVLFFVSNELNSTTRAVSSVSGGGLTWAQLTSRQFNTADGTSQHNNMEVWWAKDAAGHSAGTLAITVVMDGAVDDAVMSALTVTGANGTTPLDVSGAFSATNTTTSVTTVAVSGVSTTNTDTVLFGFFGSSGNARPSAATGFTEAVGTNNPGGSNFESQEVQYKVESAAQSSITLTTTGSQCARWGFIAFGIQAAATDVDIPATTHTLGVNQATTLFTEIELIVSMSLGLAEAVALGDDIEIINSPLLGVGQAVALEIARELSASALLGVLMAVTITTVGHKQPVIFVIT